MQIHAHTDKILECIINVNLRRGHSVKKKSICLSSGSILKPLPSGEKVNKTHTLNGDKIVKKKNKKKYPDGDKYLIYP